MIVEPNDVDLALFRKEKFLLNHLLASFNTLLHFNFRLFCSIFYSGSHQTFTTVFLQSPYAKIRFLNFMQTEKRFVFCSPVKNRETIKLSHLICKLSVKLSDERFGYSPGLTRYIFTFKSLIDSFYRHYSHHHHRILL